MRILFAAAATFALLHPASARADAVHDALEAYALYQTDVSALLDTEIRSGRDVDAALARLGRHDPDRVARGWIAYGALTAAQSPQFAAGVREIVRDTGRGPVLSQLRGDLLYARREPAGATQAVQLILSAANADSARVTQASGRYDRFARLASTAMRQAGGEANLSAAVRLSPAMRNRLRVTAVSSRPMSEVTDFGGRGFWDSLSGREARAPRTRNSREERDYVNVTNHMLTIAAIILADGTRAERRRVSALLNEPLTQQCMQMQQLQLRQCLSVSVDTSERSYCLGRHALAGPGQCFSNVVR